MTTIRGKDGGFGPTRAVNPLADILRLKTKSAFETKLMYEVDPKTQALNRVLFHATLDGDPIDGTVEFANVPGGGPSYAARTTVTAPNKKLTAKIENFSYVRQ